MRTSETGESQARGAAGGSTEQGDGNSAYGNAAHEAKVGRDSSERVWPWLGVLAVILGYFATWAVQFSVSNDALMAGGEVLLTELRAGSNETLWRVSSGIGYVGVGCLVWFAAGLHRTSWASGLVE